jgi:hypothetical protein
MYDAEDVGPSSERRIFVLPGTDPAISLTVDRPHHLWMKLKVAFRRGKNPNCERIKPQIATSMLVDSPV